MPQFSRLDGQYYEIHLRDGQLIELILIN